MAQTVITRYPPSPTGHPHVGGIRTALFNYLFAKQQGGKIILRFEDTDKQRSKPEFEKSNYEALTWLGLEFDAIYKQSERTLVYKKYLEKMIEEGTAYISSEDAFVDASDAEEGEGRDEKGGGGDDREKREHVVRFKNPNKKITFSDLLHDDITIDTTELNDFIIAKSVEEPLYHFAVVVDDFEMGVTHVIRGVDGIYNTPRQILIQEAIGAPRPVYCHIPFILGEDKAKLSKRNGSLPISFYRDEGFLPEALLNYLALLGWHPKDTQEIFTLSELVSGFDLTRVQKAGAIFDIEKLKHINKQHLKKLSKEEWDTLVLSWLPSGLQKMPGWSEERCERLMGDVRERIATLGDIKRMAESGDFNYIFDDPIFEVGTLIPPVKADKKGESKPVDGTTVEKHIRFTIETLTSLSEEAFTIESIKKSLFDYATKEGRGAVLWPMRMALSGADRSPDPFTLAYILGKEETLKRLLSANERLVKFNAR